MYNKLSIVFDLSQKTYEPYDKTSMVCPRKLLSFSGSLRLTWQDQRRDYKELRFSAIGLYLDSRLFVCLLWTEVLSEESLAFAKPITERCNAMPKLKPGTILQRQKRMPSSKQALMPTLMPTA